METKTVQMTADQFVGFLASVPATADIKRKGLTVTVSAVHRQTGILTQVFKADQNPDGSWDVKGPAPLFKATVRVVKG